MIEIKKGSGQNHTPNSVNQRYKKDSENSYNSLLSYALNELYTASKSSKKTEYTLADALKHKHLGTVRVKSIIQAFNFLSKNPLRKNDYYKYLNAYIENGVKLDINYFRHDVKKLNDYYTKYDNRKLNPFNTQRFEEYVVYITLKIKGGYNPTTDDEIFNVITTGNREYNPLTNIPSVLRGEIPFKVKEYDIVKAFPTFIDIELKTDYRFNVYDVLSKKAFAIALNSHNQCKVSIEDARNTLSKIYSTRSELVLTDERFNERGKAFNDFAYYESEYIQKFITTNNITNFARLHDGVFVDENINVENTQFDKVEFAIKECIKPKIENDKKLFYEYDEKGNVLLTPTGVSDSLIQENFVRISTADDKIKLLKNDNNIIDYFCHRTNLVSFLESKIIEPYKDDVKDAIARHNNSTIAQSLTLIKPTELNYYKDTKTSFGLPFKNGFIYFDSLDSLELKAKPYKEVDGFFTPHKVQDTTFNYTDEIGDFETFIYRASTGVKEYNSHATEFQSLMSLIGYSVTSYKKPSDNPIIVLTDEGATDETRNGRRGKSLLTLGIGNVTKKLTKGGNEFRADYTHNFAELNESHRIYVLDDVPAGFNYNDLYTVATGSISVQPKGSKAFEIDFKDSPKFIVTTNYLFRLNKDDSSSVARFVEFKFKPYYNVCYTPEMEFGNLFFEDWDSAEWNKFYSFIYRSVFYYLNNGIQRIDYDKTEDNFRATFSEVAEEIMEESLNRFYRDKESFKVSEFISQFQMQGREYGLDRFIHQNNAKKLINTFIEAKPKFQNYVRNENSKQWIYQIS